MKAKFLLACFVIAVGCGLPKRSESLPVASARFLLLIADHTAMSWPASAHLQSAAPGDLSNLGSAHLAGDKLTGNTVPPQDGLFGFQAGEPLPWQHGVGRNLARGPWGATGLLDLPLTNPPRRCSPRSKWLQMVARVSAFEAEYEIPRSAMALDAFDSFSGSVDAVQRQECAVAVLVDCLRAVFEAMPEVPRTRSDSAAMVHPMFRYARHYNSCFRPTAVVENPSTPPRDRQVNFDIADGRLVFAPERVFSILIFSGVQDSLAKALERTAPIAVVPIPPGCTGAQDSGACLQSPLPLSACTGCEKLIAEELYSVFLIERPGVLDEQILPVLLRLPRAE